MKRLLGMMVVVVCAAGCLGGQSEPVKQQSDAVGDQSRGVPAATLLERNWKEAATGRGAAGRITPEELARLDHQSAPGGDAGPPDAAR